MVKGPELAAICIMIFVTVTLLMIYAVLEYAKTHRIEPVDDVESGSIDQTLPSYTQPPPDYQNLPPPIYCEKPPSCESVNEKNQK